MRNKIFLLAALGTLSLSAAETPPSTVEETVGTPWSIKATDHLLFSNASDDAANPSLPAYKLFMNEASIRADYGATNGRVQFSNRYTPDGSKSKNAGFRLEKKLIAYEGEKLEVKLGDSYQELGKGIALSLYNDSYFGIDNTVEGASVAYRSDGNVVGTFAGRVNTLRLPVTINPVIDFLASKDVWLGAVHGKAKYGQEGTVGTYGLVTLDQDYTNQRITNRYATAGIFIQQDNLIDGVDAYVESNMMNTDNLTVGPRSKNSYGSYASLSWSPLPWKFKLEGKDYRNFSYDWRRPPTLEEDVVRENNFFDVAAVRLAVERRISDSGTAKVYASNLVGYDREKKTAIYHPAAGTKFSPFSGGEMEVKGGYRWLTGNQTLYHAGIKTKIKTFKAQAVEMEYRKQYWTLGLDSVKVSHEDRNIFTLGYSFSEAISSLIGYEYMPTNDNEAGKHFFNIGGAYRTANFQTRGFIGRRSAGVQCSGGICQKIDAYTGAFIDTTVSF